MADAVSCPTHGAQGESMSCCIPGGRAWPAASQGESMACCGPCGDAGIRTPYLLRAKQALSQVSYIPRVVGHPGLEPGASVLSGLRSNHLS